MTRYATLADVAQVITDTRWLIRGWLARGCITVIFGKPEAGKSALTVQLARHLFFGESWPDGEACGQIGNAVWVETEAAQSLLTERGRNWGMPMDQIMTPAPADDPLRDCMIDSDADWQRLEASVRDTQSELLVIDSLRGAHNQKEDAQLNKYLKHLAALARDTQAAVVVVHHPRKDDPKFPGAALTLDDLRGSGTLAAQARVVWCVEKAGDREPSVLRVLKSSYDDKPAPLSFHVTDLGFHWVPVPKPTAEETGALEAACGFLKRTLTEGQVPSDDVLRAAAAANINPRTLGRARKKLGVRAVHERKAGGRWFMRLPE